MHKKVFLSLLILLCSRIMQPTDSLNDIKVYVQENPGNLSVICSVVSIAAMLYDYNVNYPKWYNKTYVEELDILDHPMGLDNYLGVYLIGFKGTVPAKALKIVATIMTVAAGVFTYKWRYPALVPPPLTPKRPGWSGVFAPPPSQAPSTRSSLSSLPPPLQPVTPPQSSNAVPQPLPMSPGDLSGEAEVNHEEVQPDHGLQGVDGVRDGSEKTLLSGAFDPCSDPFGAETSPQACAKGLPAAAQAPHRPVGTPRGHSPVPPRRPSVAAAAGQDHLAVAEGRRTLGGRPVVDGHRRRGSSIASRAAGVVLVAADRAGDFVAEAEKPTVAALDAMLLQIGGLEGKAKEALINNANRALSTLKNSGQIAQAEITRLTKLLQEVQIRR